ncbi:hypothetical protein HAX54_010962, partial [Datura stramonium]|nr:hypothetical protein [Datura stramonium]
EIINIPHEEESIKDVVLIEKNKQDEEEGGGGGIINVKNNEVDQEDHEENKLLGRSNSELKAIIMVETNEKKKKNVVKGIQRSKSERYDLLVNGDEEIKDDEFSDMSVEELNRRVEEFIQRFNRQIRLQAATRNLQI